MFQGFVKSLAELIDEKAINQETKLAVGHFVIALIPSEQAFRADYFEVLVGMQLKVLGLFVFRAAFTASEVLCRIIARRAPREA